ncbi:MAG: AAA family ATPase, partial [Butyrivibrio sp.]|nr:AAA family ATPase [Butyrivibrio sp.]
YIRALFNNTFKTNTHLERALMTGITRVSKESIFSDLNNLKVITTTSMKYTTAFGFTEEEVFAAMDEQGFDPGLKETVKYWYDGFTFGDTPDIYNPWSITSYLEEKEFNTYWADTSSNGLVGNLLRAGNREFKESFEQLLNDESIQTELDEQIVFSQLGQKSSAVWSLLVASGYLKIVEVDRRDRAIRRPVYTLRLTNLEVKWMFYDLISVWFDNRSDAMPNFIKCMLAGNVEDMNNYLNRIARDTFSSFDTGTHPSESAPERFYHGFVLGLLVDKAADYVVKSNRESGYGRYDVVMEPKDIQNPAVIMEFKVYDERKGEQELSDTVTNALQQIEDKHYDTDLLARGIPQERIYKYGFAFRGREILIGME